jgi:hypothetical protein
VWRRRSLREKPETEPSLNEMPVARQDIRNSQFLCDNHCSQIREGNVRFVSKRHSQLKGLPKPCLRDLLNPDAWRCQQPPDEPFRLIKGPAAKKQADGLVENKICRENIA